MVFLSVFEGPSVVLASQSYDAHPLPKANSLTVYSESMLSWPFFLKKNGTRRKSPLRTISEFALVLAQPVHQQSHPLGLRGQGLQIHRLALCTPTCPHRTNPHPPRNLRRH